MHACARRMHAHTHTHTHTNQRYVGNKWDLSVVLKDEADSDRENLIFFESVFQRVGAKKEKKRSPYGLVLTDGMHSILVWQNFLNQHYFTMHA